MEAVEGQLVQTPRVVWRLALQLAGPWAIGIHDLVERVLLGRRDGPRHVESLMRATKTGGPTSQTEHEHYRNSYMHIHKRDQSESTQIDTDVVTIYSRACERGVLP